MLRIRNDIDLKQLELYGFKETSNGNNVYKKNVLEEDEIVCDILVNDINNFDRRVQLYFTNPFDTDCEVELLSTKIDVLYDLIKDGIIEKI